MLSPTDSASQGELIQTGILLPKKDNLQEPLFLPSRAVLCKHSTRGLNFRRDKKHKGSRNIQGPHRTVFQNMEQSDRESRIFYSIHCTKYASQLIQPDT